MLEFDEAPGEGVLHPADARRLRVKSTSRTGSSWGAVHEKVGLPIRLFPRHVRVLLAADRAAASWTSDSGEPAEALFEAFHSLTKLLFFDIGLGVDTYIYQRERTIALQQDAIRKLSTPVLRLRDRLLVLPIVGILDTTRAQQLTQALLGSIRESRATVVILDVTGVPAVDSAVANHLLQTVEAARLMGALVIVTGVSAEVAQSMVALGIDLEPFTTVGDLQGGVEDAERMLGYRVVALFFFFFFL